MLQFPTPGLQDEEGENENHRQAETIQQLKHKNEVW